MSQENQHFAYAKNKDADQLFVFCYTDSTIPLLPKSEISSLQPSYGVVQPGLCQTWSETPKTVFLASRLIYITNITEISNRRVQHILFFRSMFSFYHSYPNFSDKQVRANSGDPDQTAQRGAV